MAFWLAAVVVLAGFPSWSAAADPAAVLLTVTGNIQPAKTAAAPKVTFNFKELSALGTTSIRAESRGRAGRSAIRSGGSSKSNRLTRMGRP